MNRIRLLFFTFLLIISFGSLWSIDYTWDGTGDGTSWTDANNWVADSGIPGVGDKAIIPTGFTGLSIVADTEIGDLEIDGTSVLTITNSKFEVTSITNGTGKIVGDGATLNFYEIASLSTLNVTGGALTVDFDSTIADLLIKDITFSPLENINTVNTTLNNSTLNVASGKEFTISDTYYDSVGNSTIAGVGARIGINQTIGWVNAVDLSANSTFIISGDSTTMQINNFTGDGTSILDIGSTNLEISNGLGSLNPSVFSNTGMLTIWNSGNARLNGIFKRIKTPNSDIVLEGDITLSVTADEFSVKTLNVDTYSVTINGNATFTATTEPIFRDLNIFGTLTLGSNISIDGDWSNSGTFTHNDKGVTFVNSIKTSNIYGDNTFYNFTCATDDKVLVFEANKTQTVTNALVVSSSDKNNAISLSSSVPGTQWTFRFEGASDSENFKNILVSDSIGYGSNNTNNELDAGTGGADYSYSGGNNTGWNNFYASTEWTGVNSDVWTDGGNWTAGAPVTNVGSTAGRAVIPPGLSRYPVITVNEDSGLLIISPGGMITINGCNLGMNYGLRQQGSVLLNSGATIERYESTSGTVEFYGNATTTAAWANDFYNLNITASGTVVLDTTRVVNGALNINSGALDLQSNTLTIAGDITVHNSSALVTSASTNPITISGDSTLTGNVAFNDLTINAGVTLTLMSDISISGNLVNNGTIITNNHKVTFNGTTIISGNSISFGTVEIASGNSLTLSQNIELGGDWINSGTFDSTTNSNSVEIILGVGSTTIYGTNTFDSFICNAPGKTILLESGSTQTINNLTLKGSEASLITLGSSGLNPFVLNNVTSASIDYISVSNSTLTGLDINAGYHSVDGGSNELVSSPKWVFPRDIYEWTGDSDSDWNNLSNWEMTADRSNPSVVPGSSDWVMIPTGKTNYPVINSTNVDVKNLNIADSASVLISGTSVVTVYSLNNDGTISISDTAIINKSDSNSGVFEFIGAISIPDYGITDYYTLKLSGAGTKTLTSTLSLSGDLILSSGTMDSGNNDIYVAGNWNVQAGATYTSGTNTTYFNGSSTIISASTFNNVEVSNGAVLSLSSSISVNNITIIGTLDSGTSTVSVGGNWNNTSGVFNRDSGVVEFVAGGGASTITGSSVFNILKCRAAGKTINFETGSLQSFYDLDIIGTSGSLITLQGLGSWSLNNLKGSTALASYVHVTYGDVDDLGNSIEATNSVNDGTNPSDIDIASGKKAWLFTTAYLRTWNGSVDSNVGDSANWTQSPVSPVTALQAIDSYVITTTGTAPVLTGNVEVYGLIIETGAVFDTATFDVVINGDLDIQGTGKLLRSGTSAQSISKTDVDSGTVEYVTATADIQTYAGTDYYNLTINGGTKTILEDLELNGAMTLLAGTFTPNNNSVTFAGAGNVSITGSFSFYDLVIDKAGVTDTVAVLAGISLSNDLTISEGILDFNASDNTVVHDLILSGGTLLGGSGILTLGEDWNSSGGSFTAETSTVLFNTANVSIISGSNTFNNLSSTTANKEIKFTAGTTQTITGTLTLTGGANPNQIDLVSTIPGNIWNMSSASSAVQNVIIQDSTVTGGANIVASGDSVDNGNNTITGSPRWLFGQYYIWDGGGALGDWNDTLNWDVGAIPNSAIDFVTIPTTPADTATNWPLLQGATTLAELTIENGANLDLNGKALTVNGTYNNLGTLKVTGLVVGSINKTDIDSGTVEYSGTGTVMDFGATDYFNLVITGAGVKNLGAILDVAGNLSIVAGSTLDIVTYATTVTGTFNNAGTISRSAGGVLHPEDSNSGLVKYVGNDLTIDTTISYYDIEIAMTAEQTASLAGALVVLNNLTISSGVLSTIAEDLSVSGDILGSGTLTSSDGILTLASILNLGQFTVTGGSIVQGGVFSGIGAASVSVSGNHTFGYAINMDGTGGYTGDLTLTVDTGTLTVNNVSSANGTSSNISLSTTTSGDIVLNGVITATSSDITLISVGSITDTSGAETSLLTSSTLTIDAPSSSIGAVGVGDVEFDTTTLTLARADSDIYLTSVATGATTVTSATSTTSGVVTLVQTGDQVLTLTSVTTTAGDISVSNTGGNIDITTVTAGGTGNIGITTVISGGIALSSAITADLDDITLTSAGSITDTSGAETSLLTSATLTLTSGSNIGATGGAADIEIDVPTVSGVTAVTGIYLTPISGVTLNGITSSGAGDIYIDNTAGGVVLNGLVSATGNDITLISVGSITDTSGAETSLLTSATLTLSSGSNIGATGGVADIEIDVPTVNSVTAVTGIYLTPISGVTLNGVTSSGAGDIYIDNTAGGVVLSGLVIATGNDITLISAGSITDSSGAETSLLTSSTLTIDAPSSSIGAVGVGDVEFDTTTLTLARADSDIYLTSVATGATTVTSATSTTNGVVTLVQTGDQVLTLTSVTTTAGDISVSNTGGNIDITTVTAGGTGNLGITTVTSGDINLGVVTATGDRITLNAAGQIVGGGGHSISATDIRLTSSGNIDAGGSGLNLDATTLSAVSTAGSVDIDDSNSIIIGTVDGQSGISATSAGKDVTLTAVNNIILNENITADNDIFLTAGGSITETTGTETSLLTSSTLTLDAGTNIGVTGGTGDIEVDVPIITSATAENGIYLTTLSAVTTNTITSSGSGDIELDNTTGGVILNGVISATGDDIKLTSLGSITETEGTVTDDVALLVADTLTITAGLNIGTSTADSDIEVGINTLTDATANNGGVFITQVADNDLNVTRITSTNGNIELESEATTAGNGDIIIDSTGGISADLVDDIVTITTGTGDVLANDTTTALEIVGNRINISSSGISGTITNSIDINAVSQLNVTSATQSYINDRIGDVVVNNFTVSGGRVNLTSVGNILKFAGGKITANLLGLEAGNSVGISGTPILTNVTKVEALSGGDIYLTDDSGLVVGEVTGIITGLEANGTIHLITTNAALTINEDITNAGNAPITIDSGTGITILNSDITSTNAVVSDLKDILFASKVTIGGSSSILTTTPATVDLDVTFANTIDGAATLSINAGIGYLDFNGVIGGTTPLSSLTTNAIRTDFTGIGAGADGVTGNLLSTTPITTGIILLEGTNYRVGGSQTFTVGATGGLYIDIPAALTISVGSTYSVNTGTTYLYGATSADTISLVAGTSFSFVNLNISLPGKSLSINNNITASNIVLYNGAINLNGKNLTITNDLVLLGSGYDTTDPDTTEAGIFAYDLSAYPSFTRDVSINTSILTDFISVYDPIYVLPAGYTGSFPNLLASTITVGKNFYNNGCDMLASGAWTLDISDNNDSTIVFAEAYNMSVQNSSSNYYVAARESVIATTSTNWATTTPVLDTANSNVYTVYDDVIRISLDNGLEFENTNNEISAAISSGLIGVSNNGITGADLLSYTDPECTQSTDDLVSPGKSNDLSVFYLRVNLATASYRWNTDATGLTAGLPTSTDRGRSGVIPKHRTTIPDIAISKDSASVYYTLLDSHKNRIEHRPVGNRITGVLDKASPVIINIDASKHPSGTADSFDAHNYFEITYSENISYNVNSGNSTSFVANSRSSGVVQDTSGEQLGNINQSGSDVVVDGLFSYPGNYVSGSFDGTPNTNTLFSTEQNKLRIDVVAYKTGGLWPGYLGSTSTDIDNYIKITNPSADFILNNFNGDIGDLQNAQTDNSLKTQLNQTSKTVTVPGNADIIDDSNNGLEGTSIAYGAFFKNMVITGSGWDVFPPYFSKQVLENGDLADVYEIYFFDQRTTVGNRIVDNIAFHVLDNPIMQPFWRSWTGWANGVAPGQQSVRPDPIGGLRDNPFLGNDSAFKMGLLEDTTRINSVITGMDTAIDTYMFKNDGNGNFAINTVDDNYFSIQIDESENWLLKNRMNMTYNSSVGRIIDLAGNLMPSSNDSLDAFQWIPPEILLSLSVVDEKSVYVQFTKNVYSNDPSNSIRTGIDKNSFSIIDSEGNSISNILAVDGDATDTVGKMEFLLTLTNPLSANDMVSAKLKIDDYNIYDLYGTDTGIKTKRMSDLGIGLVTPVYATDSLHKDDRLVPGQGSLRVFDGTGRLLPEDVEIATRIEGSNNQNLDLSLFYDMDTDLSGAVDYDESDNVYNPNLWLPETLLGIYIYDNLDLRELTPSGTDEGLKLFSLDNNDDELKKGAKIQFLYKLNTPEALYCVSKPPGGSMLTDLIPWEISIEGLKDQRNGVTIVNNVLNPLDGYKTELFVKQDKPGMSTIAVFSLDGAIVKKIQNGRLGAGSYRYQWDGTNKSGTPVARGIYFIKVVAPGINETRKVMIVK